MQSDQNHTIHLNSVRNGYHVQILLETGEIGRQANGAVMLTCGKTVTPCSPTSHAVAAHMPHILYMQLFPHVHFACMQVAKNC